MDFHYDNNRLTWIGQQRGATLFKYVSLDYQPVTIPTGGSTIDPPTLDSAQVWLISRITYPTGMNFRFSYNDFGICHTIQKWAPELSGQGAARMVAQTTLPYVSYAGYLSYRTEWAENWQGGNPVPYAYNYDPTGQYDYYPRSVTDPAGRWFRFRVEPNTLKIFSAIYASNGRDTVRQKQDIFTYTKDPNLSYTANLRLIKAYVESNNSARSTSYTYTQFDNWIWLPTVKDENEVYRRTVTEYLNYPAQNLYGLPGTVTVWAGAGVTLLAKTTNVYDETNSVTDANGQAVPLFASGAAANVVQHDDANYGTGFTQRGNLTSVQQYWVVGGNPSNPRVLGYTAYDKNGNVRDKLDAAGNRQSLAYGDYCVGKPTNVGETHVVPYTVADPTGFRSGAQWNYFTGQTLKTFNLLLGSSEEQQIVTTSYDFADRPKETMRPDEGLVKTHYWDNLLIAGTLQQIEPGKVRFKWEISDGAGHTYIKASDHPSAVTQRYAAQRFIFDQLGQVQDSSNVVTVDGSLTPVGLQINDLVEPFLYTHLTRDQLSRLKLITFPDNNTRQYSYTGCGCAGNDETFITDELGHQTVTKHDSFGRLSEATEFGQYNNGVQNQAVYLYDELDRLKEIQHTAVISAYQSPVPTQTRTFSYDGYGRLTSETTPEGGTVTYTYTANDQVATKTDARGVVVTNQYDKRNLVTQTSYSGNTAPTVTYSYDAYGARQTMTDGEGQTTYAYNNFRQLQSETRTFAGLTGKIFSLSYSYNQADQVKQVVYAGSDSAAAPPRDEELQAVTDQRTARQRQTASAKPPAQSAAEGQAEAKTSTVSASLPTSALNLTALQRPADFDGDGKTDIAVWRGPEGNWLIRRSSDNSVQTVQWGSSLAPYYDVPVPADYDGDGKADAAVFRRSNATWYVRNSSSGNSTVTQWGLSTDALVPGDYDGDGKADLAVWRGANTNWYILKSSNGQSQITSYGASSLGDLPAPGDYDGDGKTDIAVWRPGTATWYILRSTTGASLVQPHGQLGDTPVTAALPPPPASGTLSLSGQVTDPQGNAVAGATVYLSGAQSGQATTDANGQYSFSGLTSGGSYTLTAAQSGYGFSPASRSYANLTANVTGANFLRLLAGQFFARTINYSYNNVGALAGVGTNLIGDNPNATTNVLNTTTFRANGAIKSLIYGNGRQLTMGYNANRQQPITMKVDRVGNPNDKLIDYAYEYYTQESEPKNNNRIRKIIDNLDGNYTVNYQYDEYNRLTQATASAYTRYYGYDGFGNLRLVGGTGGPHANYALNYALNGSGAPATNRIASVTENGATEPFTYDAAGNLTAGDGQTYAYDGASRLSSVNGGLWGQYGYDGDGLRVKKVEGGATSYYIQSSVLGQVAFEQHSTLGIARAYVVKGGNQIAVQSYDGNFYWIHTNHLGNSRKLTNTSGDVV